MKKWKKRILRSLLVSVALLLIVGGVSWYLYHQPPDWYKPISQLAPEDRKSAANDATQKLGDVVSWAAGIHARSVRLSQPGARSEPPPGPLTISLTQDEINSFLQAWREPEIADIKDSLSQYFTDGQVVLSNHQIILAGQSKDMGTVVSVGFRPQMDETGQLNIAMGSISLGRLPIPNSIVAAKLKELRQNLVDAVQEDQSRALMSPMMAADSAAAAADFIRLFVDAIDGKPSPALMFVPFDLQDWNQCLVVRITAVDVEDGLITLTLTPIPSDQRQTVLDEIKQPVSNPD
jgi:uncharacterized protein YpmS